jgi:hypothetical protein
VVARFALARLGRRRAATHQELGRADIEPAPHDLAGQCRRVRRRQQRAGMPGAQRALVELALDGRRQSQQSQRVGDMAAALADCLGDLSLAVPELLHQAAVGLRLLERGQILALQILDERDLQDLGIAKRPDDDRHFVQSGALRRAPPPLAGDQLEFRSGGAGIGDEIIDQIVDRPHQERLDDPLLADRLHKTVEFGFDKAPPRLERRRTDCLDRDRARRPGPGQHPAPTLAE